MAEQNRVPDGGKGPTSPGCEKLEDVLTVLYGMVQNSRYTGDFDKQACANPLSAVSSTP